MKKSQKYLSDRLKTPSWMQKGKKASERNAKRQEKSLAETMKTLMAGASVELKKNKGSSIKKKAKPKKKKKKPTAKRKRTKRKSAKKPSKRSKKKSPGERMGELGRNAFRKMFG